MSVYHTYRFNHCLDGHFIVTCPENILVEYILDAFFLHCQLRYELITAFQRCLESHIDACYHWIYPLFVECGKADTRTQQELVPRMLQIMLVVGIVDNTLKVAFIVADQIGRASCRERV